MSCDLPDPADLPTLKRYLLVLVLMLLVLLVLLVLLLRSTQAISQPPLFLFTVREPDADALQR